MTDLPTGWAQATLSDIAEVRLGRQRSPKNHTGTSMRPYLRAANVGWSGLLLDDVKEMNFTDEEAEIYRLEPGDIIMGEASGSAGEVGKPALWSGEIDECCFQNTLIRIRSRGVDPQFLVHYLRYEALRGAFAGDSRGVGIHHLGASRISQWPINVPPVAEQRRLVEELQQHLASLQGVSSKLRSVVLRTTALREKITGIATIGESRHGERVAASLEEAGVDDGELPLLPPGWRWARLGEIAQVVGGITKDSKKQGDPSFVNVPYLRVANVQRGRLDLEQVSTIFVPPKKAEQLYLKHGDVLLNEGGDRDKLGRGWIWENEIPHCIHQNHVFRARVSGDVLHPKLLAWHANNFGKLWCERNGKQSVNLASISLSKIRLLPVVVPPREIQDGLVDHIENRLTMTDSVLAGANSGLRQESVLRRAIMSRAFAGDLVEQYAFEEPASALLASIVKDQENPKAPRRGGSRRVLAARSASQAVQETLL